MGIWRVAIDEVSGRAREAPEAVASGVDVAMDLPHLSRDGSTLILRSKLESINPAAIEFDPATARIGAVTLLQHRTGSLVPFDASPDGKWLALASALDRQQDLFIMRADGSGLTRLTDDAARDWSPRFTPDGSALTFYSNPHGKFDGFSIRLDGSGRTRLSDLTDGVAFTMFAPDGKRLMSAALPKGARIATAPWPMTDSTGTPLTNVDVPGGFITPSHWSRGGRWFSGYVSNAAGEVTGFGVIEGVSGRATRLNDDSRGFELAWLPDDRHVVYFTSREALVMQDVVTLERRTITGTLPYPPDGLGGIVGSHDGRTLYYGARQTESNLWIVRRAPAPADK
jgi:WD40-like Beta Propeller Repeat